VEEAQVGAIKLGKKMVEDAGLEILKIRVLDEGLVKPIGSFIGHKGRRP
jgi:hypothetical protein